MDQTSRANELLLRQSEVYDRLTHSVDTANRSLASQIILQDRLGRAYQQTNLGIDRQLAQITKLKSSLDSLGRSFAALEQATRRAGGSQRPGGGGGGSAGMFIGSQPFPMMLPGGHSPTSSVTRELTEVTNTVNVRIVDSVMLKTLTVVVGGPKTVARGMKGELGTRSGRLSTRGILFEDWANTEDSSGMKADVGERKLVKGGLEKIDWNKIAQQIRTVGSAFKSLDFTLLDAGRNIDSLGAALTAWGTPKMIAIGAGVSLAGEAISKLGEEGRKQRDLVVNAYTDMTKGAKVFSQAVLDIKINTLSEGLRRAAESATGSSPIFSAALTLGRFGAGLADLNPFGAGGNAQNFNLVTARAQARQNVTNFSALERDPEMARTRREVSMMVAERGMNQLSFNAMDAARGGRAGGLRTLMLGGTGQQANDAAQRELLISTTARATRRPNEALDTARIRVADALHLELELLRDSQRDLRAVNFAREAMVRNQFPLEAAGRRRVALGEAAGAMSPIQQQREAADIFRGLVDAAGPLNRLSQAFMEFTPEAASAINRAQREQLGQDPTAQALVVQRALLEQARQQTDYNRRAADALESIIVGAGI